MEHLVMIESRAHATTSGSQSSSRVADVVSRAPVVVIPAYKPTEALPGIVKSIAVHPSIGAVVIVNDGSGPEFDAIFSEVSHLEGVHVLRHVVNLGKGAALKTGLNHVACYFPQSAGVVTADADGQHAARDIVRTAEALTELPQSLVLGARTFPPDIPLRSRLGNVITCHVLRAVTGQKISDTQTGLRGIPMNLIPTLMRIRQNGYDFELEMLLTCRRESRRIAEVPIETIYLDGNRSSHFNPLLDSMRIYFLFIRFAAVSLSTALLDNLVFLAAFRIFADVLTSQCLGRLSAGLFNYYMNKTGVFHSKVRDTSALPKYWLSVAIFGGISYSLIKLLISIGFSVPAAKLCSETLLFAFSFVVQRDFVFSSGRAQREE
jgi:putative flippase GtrA